MEVQEGDSRALETDLPICLRPIGTDSGPKWKKGEEDSRVCRKRKGRDLEMKCAKDSAVEEARAADAARAADVARAADAAEVADDKKGLK